MSDDLEMLIEREFSGHGVAIREQGDAPIPGEPFMSMAVAKDLVRSALKGKGEECEDLKRLLMGMTYERDEYRKLVDIREDEMDAAESSLSRMKEALEIIAGNQQCLDNLMSNQDVARYALSQSVDPQSDATAAPETESTACYNNGLKVLGPVLMPKQARGLAVDKASCRSGPKTKTDTRRTGLRSREASGTAPTTNARNAASRITATAVERRTAHGTSRARLGKDCYD